MTPRSSEFIQIPASFTRSVQIEKDLFGPQENDTRYLVTPLFRQMVHRILEGLQYPMGNRAWTILGPYGTGKSAAVLNLVRLLVGSSSEGLQQDIKAEDPSLIDALTSVHMQVGPFTPILVSGYRGCLTKAVHSALLYWANHHGTADDVARLAIEATDPGDSQRVADLVARLSESHPCVVVIDELGKFLEYSSQHPEDGDVFLLQLLAENAARAAANPTLVITVLHQAAERYGTGLLQSQRNELTKVQGRFEEISFLQPTEQMLRLISSAIVMSGPDEVIEPLRRTAAELAHKAYDLGLAPPQMPEQLFTDLMVGCAPLHPVAALLLGPLFRKVAQNERSLFAFLSSVEPHGFRSFLSEGAGEGKTLSFYPPDRLYDYVATACGVSLFSDLQGRKWAQTDAALDRIKDPTELETRIIKLVGLIGVTGELASLRPTADIIELSLQNPEVQTALDSLRNKSVLVHRKFMGAFRLWEGSDLDLDERVSEASKNVTDGTPLDELIKHLLSPRAEVARRHSHLTGTLRFFSVHYITAANLQRELPSDDFGEADGRLFYILTESPNHLEAVTQIVRDSPPSQSDVLVPLRVPLLLRTAALELMRLQWVEQNTPELATDDIARRELNARILETRRVLQRELEAVHHPQTGHPTVWYLESSREIRGRRELNQCLSEVCDAVYSRAPHIHNELINRRQPSSNATAARRDLLERMIVAQREEQLGIQGYPPHLSMYLSVLRLTGVHRQLENGDWAFVEPASDSPMGPVWEAWQEFLETTRASRRPLGEFWARLEQSPYGLKAGVIPVLICAMLLERQLDVALYEQGTFVPDIETPHMERLSKSPDRFEVRYCPLDGLRKEVFQRLREAGLSKSGDQRLLAVVKPLVQFAARLPAYSKSTRVIGPVAQQVRFHLLTAREPEVLLFESLPQALGFPVFLRESSLSPGVAQDFAQALQHQVQEISRAYLDLLDYISCSLTDSLGVSGRPSDYRRHLQMRAEWLTKNTSDLRLKGFVMRLTDSGLDDRSWLESVGTYVVGKPPAAWTDEDRDRFGLDVRQISRRFISMETLVAELHKRGSLDSEVGKAGRIGLTVTDGTGRECFFQVPPAMADRVSEVSRQVLEVIRASRAFDSESFRLAVLANVMEKLVPDE